MLPADARLRRRRDFTAAVRHGRRAAGGALVAHLLTDDGTSPRVGFVVGRGVGTAVVRNRVRRRLRHLAAHRLDRLPPGSSLVIRALPPAAAASYSQLGADLDRALSRALARSAAGRRPR